jgi:membrane-bound ClpP family serine protease
VSDPMLLWGLGLLAAALLVVFIEMFVPSGGLLALVAAVVAIAGVVCLFRVSALWGVIGLLAVLILGPTVIFFGLSIMPSTPFGKKLLFGESGREEPVLGTEDEARQESAIERLVGTEGVALTDLRPVGAVRLDGQRYDALAEINLIRAGTPVRVTSVEGTQIKVRPVG